MSKNFDVVVIGAGPAGYVAAIRASQNGMTVACIDEWQNRDGSNAFGGTCLNAGCIPSKALLESSELFHRAQKEFATHGIKTSAPEIDVATMQSRKDSIVKQLTQSSLLWALPEHPGRHRAPGPTLRCHRCQPLLRRGLALVQVAGWRGPPDQRPFPRRVLA
jgi:succinate dehydrogenase/fumarate reductase flavoprotein subunit